MKNLNIAISIRQDLYPPGEKELEEIKTVDQRIKLWDISQQVQSELQGELPSTAELDNILRNIEVMFATHVPQNLPARAPNLKYLQMALAGIEKILEPGVVAEDVLIANASGIYGIPIGEHIISTMLMFARRAPEFFAQKETRVWRRLVPTLLYGKTVGIVGLGNIGWGLAHLAKAFGMTVLGIREPQDKLIFDEGDADEVLPPSQLYYLLRNSDFVVLTVPYTPKTHRMIGETELAAMKPSAYLVSISRGWVVDEAALIRALKNGDIAGAGLDFYEKAPLPEDSELWGLPNVILTPQIAGANEYHAKWSTRIFCRNLRRYIDGEELFNIVDRGRSY